MKKNWFNNTFYNPNTKSFIIVNDFLSLITIVSILGIILESVVSLSIYHHIFVSIEYVAVFFFTLEYLSRIIGTRNKFRYIFSFWGLIDLLSIIPTFFHIANLTALKSARSLRILRLLRILRIAKVARLQNTSKHKERDFAQIYHLNLEIYIIAFISIVTLLGSLVYVFEHGHVNGFENIPVSMLWVLRSILEDPSIREMPGTVGGVIVGLLSRFVGLILFGFLIHVIGNMINHFLLGVKKVSSEKNIDEEI